MIYLLYFGPVWFPESKDTCDIIITVNFFNSYSAGGADLALDSLATSAEVNQKAQPAAVTPPEERLSPRAEMRLALDQGRDMLAEQEAQWVLYNTRQLLTCSN